jgi:TonB-dependent starch-binding outer membrane protein SusC
MEKLKLRRRSLAAYVLMAILMALTMSSFAQQKSIKGKIVDEKGAPVAGATVLVKGTTVGTVTDLDGLFQLSVPQSAATLSISYIGMKTQEAAIGNQTTFNVSLVPDLIGVDEIVVTGYGTQAKVSVTGAISNVNAAELNDVNTASALQRMQGRVSGVSIISSHTPGGDATVRVRGMGTINNNNPLYIIDGVPTKSGMSQLNPNDIESISVLKDASSAAIYGARGANGVIIITTKRGKTGEPHIVFDARYGMSQATNKYELLDPLDYGKAIWLMNKNSGLTTNPTWGYFYGNGAEPVVPEYSLNIGGLKSISASPDESLYSYIDGKYNLIAKINKKGTDWYDELFRTAPVQEYNFSITGGSNKGSYAFSAGMYSEDGIMIYSGWDRYSLHSNADTKLTNWLTIGESIGVTYSKQMGNFGNNGEGTTVSQAYRMPSFLPVYDIKGNFAGTKLAPTGNGANPVAVAVRDQYDRNDNLRTIGNLYAEINFMKGLKGKSLFGYDYRYNEVTDRSLKDPEFSEAKPNDIYRNSHYRTLQWNWANTLNYSTMFADIHKLDVLVGTEAVSSEYRWMWAERASYFSQDPTYMYLNSGATAKDNDGLGSDWRTFSYFARVNYDLNKKYLVEATFRRDGSSRFGANYRWGNFPAFSVGWRVSEEGFMDATQNWLYDMKLRLGWGTSGNDEVGDYNGFTTFRTSALYDAYAMTGGATSSSQGFDSSAFGNKDARWETTTTLNGGLDFTVLQGKLTFNIDVWQRKTSDMLYRLSVPQVVGDATNPYVNIGEMKNNGWDFTALYRDEIGKDLKFSITANISHYKNEVVKLSNNDKEFLSGDQLRQMTYTRSYLGWEYPSYFGYKVVGIFQTQAEADAWPKAFGTSGTYNKPGHFKYEDYSGPQGKPDGVIDATYDRQKIGSPHPDFYGGVTFDIQYKAFDLNAFWTYSYGNDMINYVNRWIDYNIFPGGGMSLDRLYKSWGSPYLKDNTKAKLAMAENSDSGSQEPSSHFIEDASYLRLKTIQLGYNLPENLLSKYNISKLRIYLQATNLVTFTKYSGLDPEIQTGTDSLLGIDQGAWPTPRQLMIGINLGI